MEHMEKINDKKSIAILTHYYKSDNYGGVLQAYALCKILNDKGFNTEQICIPVECEPFLGEKNNDAKHRGQFLNRLCKKALRSLFGVDKICKQRRESVMKFAEQEIPHSARVYNQKSIKEIIGLYDAFITGSDQVWNTDYFVPAFFLDFLDDEKNKPKLSYAASIAKKELSLKECEYFRDRLKGFVGVSVREEDAVNLLQPLSPVKVEKVLDPVFLLSKEEWEHVADTNVVNDKYIFCYFLGNNYISRKIARNYSKEKRLKIVTIQYLQKEFYVYEFMFGSIKIHNASPKDFLALIKNAEAVITDSFHAVAFASIFGTKFFVTQRECGNKMFSRLESVLSLLDENERFISNEQCRDDRLFVKTECDIKKWKMIIEEEREKSISYLDNCLKAMEN